ncbi:MAG: PIG-L family deacetylase [Lachnospiraceae bacterium]|nr:PIG-L family deacetylase [Lachnospiraceae bacterium]
MKHRVLVVAAHPDDELLGIGGIVIKHVQAGDEVRSVIMCEGESLRYGEDVGQSRAISEAAEKLGVSKVYHLKFPDQKLDTYTLTELITPLEEISEEFQPDIIYCQSGCDINRDHRILFEAAEVAFRPTSEWIRDFYCFYTASSTEWGYPRNFVPDTWIDISAVLEQKIEAFECYHSEIREYPHPRSSDSLRHQAHFWGNMCCMDAAEVLMTIRRIER